MELEFLILLDFDLYVSSNELSNALHTLESFTDDKIPKSPLVYSSPCTPHDACSNETCPCMPTITLHSAVIKNEDI